MKYLSPGNYSTDLGEPALRSCWECNPPHAHLKDTDFLHLCVWCGRYWIHSRYMDSFETEAEMDAFLKEKLDATH